MRDQGPPSIVSFHRAVAHRAIRFGPFRFDLVDRTLAKDGEEIRLPPRALAILEYLLERPGRIVPKQELMDAVWKDAFVSESSLTEAVGVLRQSLGDTASEAGHIQTVHRRGYRFVAPIQIDAQAPAALSDVTAEAETVRAGGASDPTAARRARVLPLAVSAATLVAVSAAIWWYFDKAAFPKVTRTTITLPESEAPAPGLSAHTVAALSPDGRRVVYVAGSTGSYRLFLRALDQFEAVAIPGTDGGHGPFFSPDGGSIGFFRQGRLLVMRLPDGQPLDLGPSGSGHGGWWHNDNTILFATGTTDGILRVSSNGGTATSVPVSGLNPADLREPSLTADGRVLLATHWRLNVRESEVVAIDLEIGAARVIGKGVQARALPLGYVGYVRDNSLLAAPLAGGEELPLLSGVMVGTTGTGQYSLAADGTLLYVPHAPGRLLRQLKQVRPDGSTIALPFEQRAFQNFTVSPDGQSVAATIYERGASDLWVGDISRGTLLRLTTEGGVVDPIWSADGTTVFFGSTRSGEFRIYRIAADGSGQPAPVSSVTDVSPASASSEFLFAQRISPGQRDILRIGFDSGAEQWLATRALEGSARISPAGGWVAYESNRSGRLEVYLRAVEGGAERQVSAEGASQPSWSSDGRFLYFVSRRRVFRARVSDGQPGAAEQVHADPSLLIAAPGRDGLIVLAALQEARPLNTLNVVVNWLDEVRPRLAR